jgi:hypothetical protein
MRCWFSSLRAHTYVFATLVRGKVRIDADFEVCACMEVKCIHIHACIHAYIHAFRSTK